MTDQGKSPTEIARELKLKESTSISKALKKFIEKDMSKIVIDIYRFRIPNIELVFLKVLGIEYKEFLKIKYINEMLSMLEIGELLNVNLCTVGYHLKHYGISKTSSESRIDAIKKGNIDYKDVIRKGRSTRNKTSSNSNKQEQVVELFKSKLLSIILDRRIEDIEIITGFNEWGILKDKEVDIPLIFISNKMNTYRKYSIEFDGQFWHQDNDMTIDKDNRLTLAGWKHYILEDSPYMNKIELNIISICDDIVNDYMSAMDKVG